MIVSASPNGDACHAIRFFAAPCALQGIRMTEQYVTLSASEGSCSKSGNMFRFDLCLSGHQHDKTVSPWAQAKGLVRRVGTCLAAPCALQGISMTEQCHPERQRRVLFEEW